MSWPVVGRSYMIQRVRAKLSVQSPDPSTQRVWISEQFHKMLKRETSTRLGQAINIAVYWDIAIRISWQFMRPSSAFASNMQEEQKLAAAALNADTENGIDKKQWISYITNLQAVIDWHQFLGFTSAAVLGPGISKHKQSPWEDKAEKDRTMQQHWLNIMDMRTALQRITGSEIIQFRGIQAPALRAIQDGESPVVAVMPTGGGKSMLFILPVFAEPGGVIIIVIPLILLRQDIIWRCQALGILYVSWKSCRLLDKATIILIVLLTATLPPRLETPLFRWMGYTREQVSMFRAWTSHPNIVYRVWQPVVPCPAAVWFETESVVAFIRERIQRASSGKVIIYSHAVSHITGIARVLECEVYYSQQINKLSILHWFT
ncbi:uncharacterized protein BDW43DRAFT_305065 [Aspergillus alliaceus]|uniref:uncharacterized protein n=1 Tax=Petromyces alliaceus TaxID=209559 RepID=UPI0012A4863E|nr:uncharacterized protein BDW43DRAFT_305065 [Aspergillus alliaceus]KAB8226819.1 hypothetical protein BDW43DRAFT_305065 [Aspergillus alliaceus]